MKTSNKILLGFFILVFTVPIILAATLKSKIQKGEFTMENGNGVKEENFAKGTFTAFKVVRVVAPRPQLLRVRFLTSNEMKYRYYRGGGQDSVLVSTTNDTLTIQYISMNPQQEENRDWNNSVHIDVNLPAFDKLVVDGAVVIIDSFPSGGNMSVILKNRAELKDGSDLKIKAEGVSQNQENNNREVQQVVVNQPSSLSLGLSRLKNVKNVSVDFLQMNVKDQLLDELIKGIN